MTWERSTEHKTATTRRRIIRAFRLSHWLRWLLPVTIHFECGAWWITDHLNARTWEVLERGGGYIFRAVPGVDDG